MKNREVKKLTMDELKKKAYLLKKDLFNLRFKKVNGQLEDTAKINHSGDCSVFTTEYGKILYEIKLRKLKTFQDNLWKLYKSNNNNLAFLDKDVEICRCECIKYSTLENALENGFTSISDLKLKTRVGMGPCQGRTCSDSIEAILAMGRAAIGGLVNNKKASDFEV